MVRELGGVGGLPDRSWRPRSCSRQAAAEVERSVVELRREHPRWGAKRILDQTETGEPGTPGFLEREAVEGLGVGAEHARELADRLRLVISDPVRGSQEVGRTAA